MKSGKIRIGLSPCPNDTFICDALLHGKINTEGLEFIPDFEDIDTLNSMAFSGVADVLKISFFALIHASFQYRILHSGCAMGKNCGPLLISKRKYEQAEIPGLSIAIPGIYTTAKLLLHLAFPEAKNFRIMRFSEIEDSVLKGDTNAGLIIHESRFTYQAKGLLQIFDLGAFWEKRTGLPLPLGCFVIREKSGPDLKEKMNRIMKRSVEYALKHPESSMGFVKKYAQEMDDEVINAHIRLYVNEHSRSLNDEARKAIHTLFAEARASGHLPEISMNIF